MANFSNPSLPTQCRVLSRGLSAYGFSKHILTISVSFNLGAMNIIHEDIYKLFAIQDME